MKELRAEDRKRNLLSAFGPGRDSPQGKRILIADDIYTTGSTMDAAAAVLKEEGAEAVFFTVLAAGRDYADG